MIKWIVSAVVLLNGINSFACLEKLNNSLLYKTFEEKQEIIKKLKKKDMACLFEESKENEKPKLSFFLPPKKRQALRVQKFFGVNSFPIFKVFEKHFFTINTPQGEKIFGYNKSRIEFLGGPGFFEVKNNVNQDGLIIDYGEDFKSIIPLEEFNAWKGRSVSKIKNNKILNYGWAVASYGEHYCPRSEKNCSNIYKKYPLYKSHSEHGFIEPLKFFVPEIIITEITKVNENRYVVGSIANDKQGGESLYFFELNNKNKIVNMERIKLFERVRDLRVKDNRLYLFLEQPSSIGIINLN